MAISLMEELSEIQISNNYILDLDNNSNKQKIERVRIPFTRRTMRCHFCGSMFLLVNKARHERTIKHKDGVYVTTDKFEMI